MEQEPMSIFEFTKGDLITRMTPSKPIEIFGDETVVDRQYIGEPLVFLGVANGCVYVEHEDKPRSSRRGRMDGNEGPMGFLNQLMGRTGPINLPLDAYDEGWALYIDPYTIGEKQEERNDNVTESLESLQRKLSIALKKEEYEKAEKLKAKIKKLEKL